ncbi:hypothetical protein SGUI_1003 [Serinicoccus hydrothermalis]|uniref:DUF2505 domain-containing protein n=1 Tax=Serinicoccus hydrothermalis TaxID=1758689 RepID=A0A1B1NAE3_9MICO|nr:DUF2505 domain-containing protein [Serinicoccus hydrothermalis]ANS78399.1 hypothetical protein SGUI_1003 [Serinicoccus hydrothermalis]
MRITETISHAADPQRTFEMLTDHGYQVLRCERSGALDQTVQIEPEADGSTTVTTRRHLPNDGIPDIAKTLVGPQLLVVETVRWGSPDADGEREGAMSLELPGLPVSFTGGIHLRRAAGDEARTDHVVDGDLEARIPFLGNRIEREVAARVKEFVHLEEGVAREWLDRDRGEA